MAVVDPQLPHLMVGMRHELKAYSQLGGGACRGESHHEQEISLSATWSQRQKRVQSQRRRVSEVGIVRRSPDAREVKLRT